MRDTKPTKCVFLDRDGILNDAIIKNSKPYPPRSIDELVVCSELRYLLRRIRAEYYLICITNQPDVARGACTSSEVERINHYIKSYYDLDQIYTCFHDDSDNCNCRKPGTYFFYEAQRNYSFDLKRSFMVGDRSKDIEAGKGCKCFTIFVDYKYDERLKVVPNLTVKKATDALNYILQNGS